MAIAAINRRKGSNGKESGKSGPDVTVVVENNTRAMRDLTGMISDLHDLMLQATTKQEVKLDEVLAHVRMRGGGGE